MFVFVNYGNWFIQNVAFCLRRLYGAVPSRTQWGESLWLVTCSHLWWKRRSDLNVLHRRHEGPRLVCSEWTVTQWSSQHCRWASSWKQTLHKSHFTLRPKLKCDVRFIYSLLFFSILPVLMCFLYWNYSWKVNQQKAVSKPCDVSSMLSPLPHCNTVTL